MSVLQACRYRRFLENCSEHVHEGAGHPIASPLDQQWSRGQTGHQGLQAGADNSLDIRIPLLLGDDAEESRGDGSPMDDGDLAEELAVSGTGSRGGARRRDLQRTLSSPALGQRSVIE